MRIGFSLTAWAKRPEVKQAWQELVKKYDLVNGDLGKLDSQFLFLERVACRPIQYNYRYVVVDHFPSRMSVNTMSPSAWTNRARWAGTVSSTLPNRSWRYLIVLPSSRWCLQCQRSRYCLEFAYQRHEKLKPSVKSQARQPQNLLVLTA